MNKHKTRKQNTDFLKVKKIEDKKVNTISESCEINNELNYNNINPYLIENKILDNLNENEDIEINHKKNKKKIYRNNSNININNDCDENNINNFYDINKKSNFIGEKEKYKILYSKVNQNNNNSDDNEENPKISIEENSNEKNNNSDYNELENDKKENNYLNNHFEKVVPNISKNNNKKFTTKILSTNNREYDDPKNQYEEEINRLKQEIENLENDNEFLSNQLIEEEKKNEELHMIKNEKEENDNSILLDISHCLQVNSFDEILPKLTEMINYLTKYNNDKSAKIKEDTISKLKSLYIITNDSKEKKENISIQDLWRWIKQLIEEVDELSIEKERYEKIYNRNNNDIYKIFCEKLIREFGLNSFDELKFFINDLMTKNDLNKKRVENLRKVLMMNNDNNNNNDKEESLSNSDINNYNYNEENEYGNNKNNMRINNENNNFKRFRGKNGNHSLNKIFNRNNFYNDSKF